MIFKSSTIILLSVIGSLVAAQNETEVVPNVSVLTEQSDTIQFVLTEPYSLPFDPTNAPFTSNMFGNVRLNFTENKTEPHYVIEYILQQVVLNRMMNPAIGVDLETQLKNLEQDLIALSEFTRTVNLTSYDTLKHLQESNIEFGNLAQIIKNINFSCPDCHPTECSECPIHVPDLINLTCESLWCPIHVPDIINTTCESLLCPIHVPDLINLTCESLYCPVLHPCPECPNTICASATKCPTPLVSCLCDEVCAQCLPAPPCICSLICPSHQHHMYIIPSAQTYDTNEYSDKITDVCGLSPTTSNDRHSAKMFSLYKKKELGLNLTDEETQILENVAHGSVGNFPEYEPKTLMTFTGAVVLLGYVLTSILFCIIFCSLQKFAAQLTKQTTENTNRIIKEQSELIKEKFGVISAQNDLNTKEIKEKLTIVTEKNALLTAQSAQLSGLVGNLRDIFLQLKNANVDMAADVAFMYDFLTNRCDFFIQAREDAGEGEEEENEEDG